MLRNALVLSLLSMLLAGWPLAGCGDDTSPAVDAGDGGVKDLPESDGDPDSAEPDEGVLADGGQPVDLWPPAPDGGSVCGDGHCTAGETATSCAADCGPQIWRPTLGTTWQWQLLDPIDASFDVQMYDVDLYEVTAATIASLKGQGRKVICYFSAGSWEDWRPDASSYPAAIIGKALDGWEGEKWFDVRAPALKPLLQARLELAKTKGCDGVEPDNVDGYVNDSGFPLTGADQLAFNIWLAGEAHKRGLSVGLKNDLPQIPTLVAYFDWALNEECVDMQECDVYGPFIARNKAVFHVEYVDKATFKAGDETSICAVTKPLKFSTLIKELDLYAWRVACP